MNRLLADLDAARVRERMPELAFVSDKNLAIVLFQARFQRKSRSLILIAAVLGGCLVPLSAVLAMLLHRMLYQAPLTCFPLALVAISLGGVSLAAVAVERDRTRRALRRRLMSLTCFKCAYDLQSTPRASNTLTCPECGAANLFPQHPVDL